MMATIVDDIRAIIMARLLLLAMKVAPDGSVNHLGVALAPFFEGEVERSRRTQ